MRRVLALASLLVLTATVGACGRSAGSGHAARARLAPVRNGSRERLFSGVKGGTLTVYDHNDFGSLDPGEAYNSLDYEIVYATQRPLFSYLPGATQTLSPDLAARAAQIAPDGRTVTVPIRHGVHFSPPVNREVTSADVAYAIERGANPSVSTPYFPAYFDYIVGASRAHGGPIRGIATPDRYTIVFHLTGSYGALFASALSLPLTAPVPKGFAGPLDASKPTAYGSRYVVATGPYMLKHDARGKFIGIGYQPGKSAALVRNPNWNPASDHRPAYLNRVDVNIGGDPTVIGRQVLQGSHSVQNDTAAASIVQLAYQHYRQQLVAAPGAGNDYVALNNRTGPFHNVDVRKALWAGLDREAMIRATGGLVATHLGTHFIYPGSAGYEQAGGAAGPKMDYNRFPSGNMTLARRYMKAAGFPSGRHAGGATIHVVGVTGSPFATEAEIVDQTLRNLGFTTNLTLVDGSVMYERYCGVPAQEIDVCPNIGWIRDFADPQTILDPTFAGYNIVPTGNSNVGQVNNPRINSAIRLAESVVSYRARIRAWARVDRMLVGIAAAVPWGFSINANIESRDVRGINDLWNQGTWDYSYTSLR
jgi:peptide/nickel transport system substrate-binding protein